MLFSLCKHHLDLFVANTALKVSRSLYCFITSISHGVENYSPRLGGMGISDAIFFISLPINPSDTLIVTYIRKWEERQLLLTKGKLKRSYVLSMSQKHFLVPLLDVTFHAFIIRFFTFASVTVAPLQPTSIIVVILGVGGDVGLSNLTMGIWIETLIFGEFSHLFWNLWGFDLMM